MAIEAIPRAGPFVFRTHFVRDPRGCSIERPVLADMGQCPRLSDHRGRIGLPVSRLEITEHSTLLGVVGTWDRIRNDADPLGSGKHLLAATRKNRGTDNDRES